MNRKIDRHEHRKVELHPDKDGKYVIALREPNGCLVGYWNGADRNFSKFLPWKYTLRGAKSICTKTVYPMLSDSPLERCRTVSIESIIGIDWSIVKVWNSRSPVCARVKISNRCWALAQFSRNLATLNRLQGIFLSIDRSSFRPTLPWRSRVRDDNGGIVQ